MSEMPRPIAARVPSTQQPFEARVDLLAAELAELREAARDALTKAYAPYSGYRVGAALVTDAGNVHLGANVENASYGLTVCAERAAIFSAVADDGPDLEIRALAVVCERGGTCAPCGACRQVIYEFGRECIVLFDGEQGSVETSIADLLPAPFLLP